MKTFLVLTTLAVIMNGTSNVPSTADTGDSCLSPITQYDVCKKAKEIQSQLSAALPMRLNQEMIMETVIVSGPRLAISATWNMLKSELDSRLELNFTNIGSLKKNIEDNTIRYVCSNELLSAFVRLGGNLQYIYKTRDGFLIHSPIVTNCPRIVF
jgi:hypothetical protein